MYKIHFPDCRRVSMFGNWNIRSAEAPFDLSRRLHFPVNRAPTVLQHGTGWVTYVMCCPDKTPHSLIHVSYTHTKSPSAATGSLMRLWLHEHHWPAWQINQL